MWVNPVISVAPLETLGRFILLPWLIKKATISQIREVRGMSRTVH